MIFFKRETRREGGRRGGGLDEKALSRARCKKEEGKKTRGRKETAGVKE